jgi:threonine/homoserine/homoserine lactone efflux protein
MGMIEKNYKRPKYLEFACLAPSYYNACLKFYRMELAMEHFWTFLLFAVTSCITPGPNNMMLLASSLNFGIKRTVPHFLGVLFGFTFFFLMLGLGLGALFTRYELLHYIIKFLGGAYMLYLAYRIATSHNKVQSKHLPRPLSFMQAFLFQWINPKAWVVGVSSMSTYTSVEGGNQYMEIFIIVATYFVVLIPCFGVWAVSGSKLRKFLSNDRYRALFNYTMGGFLALSVALIFIRPF